VSALAQFSTEKFAPVWKVRAASRVGLLGRSANQLRRFACLRLKAASNPPQIWSLRDLVIREFLINGEQRRASMHVSASGTQAAPMAHYSFYEKINSRWHKPALWLFMVVVLAHWAEHVAQAWQIYVLGWSAHHAGGVLGLFYPWLVHTEVLHYG